MKRFCLFLSAVLALNFSATATQEERALPWTPVWKVPHNPHLDTVTAVPAPRMLSSAAVPMVSGPIAPAGTQPAGALTGRVVFTSGGHGWAWVTNTTITNWALGRPLLLSMNEDYGNLDQMTMFAFYCFNAGAIVVPMRPIGFQTNEVVLD